MALIAVAVVTPFAKVVIRMNRSVLVRRHRRGFTTSGAAIAADAGASWFAAGLIHMLTRRWWDAARVLAGEVPFVMGRTICAIRQCWARRPTWRLLRASGLVSGR